MKWNFKGDNEKQSEKTEEGYLKLKMASMVANSLLPNMSSLQDGKKLEVWEISEYEHEHLLGERKKWESERVKENLRLICSEGLFSYLKQF